MVAVFLAIGFVALGSLGPFLRRLETPALSSLIWSYAVIAGAGLLLSSYLYSPPGHFVFVTRHYTGRLPITEQLLPMVVMLLSLVSDFVFITSTRKILRWASIKPSFTRIGGFASAILLLGLALFLLPFALGKLDISQKARSIFVLLGSSNAIDAFVGSAWFLVAVLMLVHRLLWPMLERPLYALERHKVLTNHRKMIVCTGVALICVACPPVGQYLKTLVSAVHGE